MTEGGPLSDLLAADPRPRARDAEPRAGRFGSTFRPSRILIQCTVRSREPLAEVLQRFRRRFGIDPDAVLESRSWIVHVGLDGSAGVGWDPEHRSAVVLHGEVFGDGTRTAADIAREYRRRGDRLFEHLNGSFGVVLLDLDTDRLLVVPDRVSSRRIFWSMREGCHLLTSDFRDHPVEGRPFDEVGVAWALAAGGCYNRRTIRSEVRILDRAHVHELGHSDIRSHQYWSHHQKEPSNPPRVSVMAAELGERLVEAVRCRIEPGRDTFISLSGGHDSTGIAMVLSHVLEIEGIRSHAYVHGAPEGKDAEVAARTARELGFAHETLEVYDGAPLDFSRLGGWLGEGVCVMGSGSLIMKKLAPRLEAATDPVVFAGDENFGIYLPDAPDNLGTLWGYLRFKGFCPPVFRGGFLSSRLVRSMEEGIRADMAEILSRQPATDDLWRIWDHAQLDHRLAHAILPWRERFLGSLAPVMNPWLDVNVLEYMRTVPESARRAKPLYLAAMAEVAPAFATFERAHYEGNRPDALSELRKHGEVVRSWILDTQSSLDDLIPREYGLALLSELTGESSWRGSPGWAAWALRWRAGEWLPFVERTWHGFDALMSFAHWEKLRMALAEQ